MTLSIVKTFHSADQNSVSGVVMLFVNNVQCFFVMLGVVMLSIVAPKRGRYINVASLQYPFLGVGY